MSGQQLNKSDNEKQLDKKEAGIVGIWKDEETITEEREEQLMCSLPEEELALDLASLAFRIKNNFFVISFK